MSHRRCNGKPPKNESAWNVASSLKCKPRLLCAFRLLTVGDDNVLNLLNLRKLMEAVSLTVCVFAFGPSFW